ncbi:MAG: T9SS type A sorting domain-containing protein, partial [Bacteroidota bacterium]|nr:T9SS type A sorting domain-containing protein [Bacteroidota bacterium]
YVVHLTNAAGCDSAATLNLVVNATTSSTTDVTICSSALPYVWNSNSYNAAGTYVVHLTNAAGCDSAATLNLVVNATTSSTTDVTICSSALPYVWNSNSYNAAGTYTVHLTNAAGCDSAATLNLVVNATTSSTTDVTICSSALPYVWNSNSYTAAGTYVVHLTNAAGCDSAATLNLVVNATTSSTTDVTICSSALPYVWNSNSYNDAGTYTVHLTNAAGCDSAATLNLTVNATTSSTTNVTICSSALPYVWNSNSYTAAGTYVVHLTNAAGCDSAATLNLTVNATTSSTTNVTICSSALPYVWNSNSYTAAGTYTVHLTNAAGCDSAATLNLTVNATTSSTTNVTICSNALPYVWNNQEYISAGSYDVHFTNAAGCDSIATLVLNINTTPPAPTISASGATTFCQGGSVTLTSSQVNGNLWSTGETTQSIVVSTSGSYTVSYTSPNGCTSDISSPTAVIVNVPTSSTTNVTICSSALPYVWNSNSYTAAGTYTVHLTNAAGCDSAATLNLVVNIATSSTTNVAICSSALPYVWNSNSYTAAGTYTVHLTNAAGCDSAATLILTVNQATVSTTTITNCDSFIWNGTTYTTSGTYVVHLANAAGCDSTATLILTINHSTSSTTDVTVCTNNLPYIWNNDTLSEAGTYVVHLVNAAGCDSTAMLNLTVNVTPTLSGSLTGSVLTGNSFTYTPTSFTSGTTFNWSRAAVTGITNAAASGTDNINEVLALDNPLGSSVNTTYVYTLNANGCSNIQNLVVTVNPSGGKTALTPVSLQPTDTLSGLTLNVTAMPNPTTSSFNLVIKSNKEGPVTVRVMDHFGVMVENHEKIASNTTLSMGFGWSGGVYYAEVIQNGKRKVIKLIKTN